MWVRIPPPQPTKVKHLSEKGRAWYEVEIEDYYRFDRPKNQGGYWLIAKRMKVIKPVESISQKSNNILLEAEKKRQEAVDAEARIGFNYNDD